jgi:SAM-dependent methyltransferase
MSFLFPVLSRNNHDYCVDWILRYKPGYEFRILDFGCGAGELINTLRARGISAYGCDIFFEGGDYSELVDPVLFRDVIRKFDLNKNIIPFEKSSFDLVVNNQVLEHVQDMDSTLSEICRVLKPGGLLLSLFPHKNVWHEGHCGVPFLHWFPKKNKIRVYYAAILNSIGFGYHQADKNAVTWSRDFCNWLDKWTFYRDQKEIDFIFSKYFVEKKNLEGQWLQFRINKKNLYTLLSPYLQKLIVNLFGGLVFQVRKHA